MMALDLHPEDLLDKEEEGSLTAQEAGHLAAHVAQCVTCRVERAARADFRKIVTAAARAPLPSLAGDADISVTSKKTAGGPISRVDDLSEGGGRRSVRPSVRPSMSTSLRRRSTTTAVLLAAAALFLLAGGAAAALSKGVRARVAALFAPMPSAPTEVVHTGASPALPPATVGVPTVSSPTVGSATVDAPTVSSPTVGSPSIDATTVAAPMVAAPAGGARTVASSNVGLPTREPRGPAEAAVARAKDPAPPAASASTEENTSEAQAETAPSIAMRFAAANEARKRGDRVGAVALYRSLQNDAPAAPEAQVSRVSLGRLLLEDDPTGALGAFDDYLARGSGRLDEEALAGRALALQKLGRSGDEARAWSTLLATHPDTPHRDRARARLEVLAPR